MRRSSIRRASWGLSATTGRRPAHGVESERGIPCSIQSSRFSRYEKDGYRGLRWLGQLVGHSSIDGIGKTSINILGDFNLAGETWMIRDTTNASASRLWPPSRATAASKLFAAPTARTQRCNARVDDSLGQHHARRYGIPFLRVSYFGIEDMASRCTTWRKSSTTQHCPGGAGNWFAKRLRRPWPVCDATGRHWRDAGQPFTQAVRLRHSPWSVFAAHLGHENSVGRLANRQP